jgi:hypothetical protein
VDTFLYVENIINSELKLKKTMLKSEWNFHGDISGRIRNNPECCEIIKSVMQNRKISEQ